MFYFYVGFKARGTMLRINIARMLRVRGKVNTYGYFKSLGFSDYLASGLHKKQYTRMSWTTIERLCLAWRCTPNDLYEWTPDNPIDSSHPMNTLRVERRNKLNALLDSLSAKELEEIVDKIEETVLAKQAFKNKIETLVKTLTPEQLDKLNL